MLTGERGRGGGTVSGGRTKTKGWNWLTYEVIAHAAKLDLLFKLWMAQNLAADSVGASIGHDDLA